MPLFQQKPLTVVVEARQYTRMALEAEKVAEWCGGSQTNDGCEIETADGTVLAEYGDWIVKDPNGGFQRVERHDFEANYEEM